MNQDEQQPPVTVKIATLEERLRTSARVPLESALRALAKQHGQPTEPDPILRAIEYRRSMQNRSKME